MSLQVVVVSSSFAFNFGITLWWCISDVADFKFFTLLWFSTTVAIRSPLSAYVNVYYVIERGYSKRGSVYFCVQVCFRTDIYKYLRSRYYRGLTFTGFIGSYLLICFIFIGMSLMMTRYFFLFNECISCCTSQNFCNVFRFLWFMFC